MKKVLFIIVLFLGMIMPVKAADYSMRELIPERTKTTIHGENFLYKDISYHEGILSFGLVKNNSKETKNLSISVGFFDKDKKNIGTINYCSKESQLNTKEEKTGFVIDVTGANLATGKSYKNIKYIAVLGENTTCRTDGSQDFVGETVEQIGMAKNTTISDSTMMLVRILEVVAAIIMILFLYRFLFTSAYRNVDGEDVRQEYVYINKQLKKEREKELKVNPPKPKEIKPNKSKEVMEQEKIQNEKDLLDDSDLHNFYK